VKHVANKAWQDGQRHQVAVKYDELIREKWASLAYQAGATGIFDIDEAMSNLDEKVYAAALAQALTSNVERQAPAAEVKGKGKGKGKSGKDLQCHYCGKTGHKKSDCHKLKAALSEHGGDVGASAAKRFRKWYFVYGAARGHSLCARVCAGSHGSTVD